MEELGVAETLGAMGDDGPGRLNEGPEEMEVLEVAQEPDVALARLGETGGAQRSGS